MTHQETDWWYKDPHNLMVVVKTVFAKMLVNMIIDGKGSGMLNKGKGLIYLLMHAGFL